jgi:hypothetical protein
MLIVAAAIKYNNVIYTGTRHAFIIRNIREKFPNAKFYISGEQQGFVDDKGNFLSRAEAAQVAIKAGQITKLRWSDTDLFSEEMW